MSKKPEKALTSIRFDPAKPLPDKAVAVDLSVALPRYSNKYTTGPFMLPQKTHSLNWNVLNNDKKPQKVRVTVFKCGLGVPKTPEPPGPLEVTVDPFETTHNANSAQGGFIYEVQVETNSKLIFPSVEAWPGAIGDVIPGSEIRAAQFQKEMT
jgi:hypothetical protein